MCVNFCVLYKLSLKQRPIRENCANAFDKQLEVTKQIMIAEITSNERTSNPVSPNPNFEIHKMMTNFLTFTYFLPNFHYCCYLRVSLYLRMLESNNKRQFWQISDLSSLQWDMCTFFAYLILWVLNSNYKESVFDTKSYPQT